MADPPTIAAQITAALKPLGTVYRNTVPPGTPPPWLIFFKVSGQDTSTFDTADTGASYVRYQIDAWATDPTAAARLSAAARAAPRCVPCWWWARSPTTPTSPAKAMPPACTSRPST